MKKLCRSALFALVLALGAAGGLAQTAFSGAPPTDQVHYRLLPNDRLAFRIEEDPVKSADPITVSVTPLGEIHFPVTRGSDLAVVVNARGKSISEVRSELKSRLDSDYYQNSTVFLSLLNQTQSQGKVLFLGPAIKGTIYLRPGETKTLTEAIIHLGYNDFVNLKKVTVERIDPVTKQPSTITVDVDAVIRLRERARDLPLQDGDRVKTVDKVFSF
jgi:protein involved in polysaccharide export with SLBB domain